MPSQMAHLHSFAVTGPISLENSKAGLRRAGGREQAVEFVYDSAVETVSSRATEFTSAMAEDAPLLPFLSPVAGKPVHVAFDGGRLTSDAGVLVLAEIERRLAIAERLPPPPPPPPGRGAAPP